MSETELLTRLCQIRDLSKESTVKEELNNLMLERWGPVGNSGE